MSLPAGLQHTLVAALALGAAGCSAKRHLVVLSTPPGATVRLDNEVIGQTPLDHEFDHFGGRSLTLYLEGHRPGLRTIDIEPPWYATFPMDLFTELLFPVGYRFVHTERFALVPEAGLVSEPDLEEALERAERLRRGGLMGPRPDLLPPPQSTPLENAPVEGESAP